MKIKLIVFNLFLYKFVNVTLKVTKYLTNTRWLFIMKHNMSLAILKNIGLTDKEADIYELLLRLGELPPTTITKELKLKRPTVYKSLYALEKKGLVSKIDTKKIHFRPEPPTQLLAVFQEQEKDHKRIQEDIRLLIPSLTASYLLSVERPVVSTFGGFSGLKTIYEDTIRENKEIKAVLQTGEVDEEMFVWLTKVYAKKRAKSKIKAKVIISSGKWSENYIRQDKKELRQTLKVPADIFPFKHEIDIYGDKIAFINYKKNEKLMGVVINHPQIARTMEAWFDLAWFGAEKFQKEG